MAQDDRYEDRMTAKAEYEKDRAREYEHDKLRRFLEAIIAANEEEMWGWDGGVHTIGARVNDEEFCITVEVVERTDRFNNQVGEFRKKVVELMKRYREIKDPRRAVVIRECPRPVSWPPDRP